MQDSSYQSISCGKSNVSSYLSSIFEQSLFFLILTAQKKKKKNPIDIRDIT